MSLFGALGLKCDEAVNYLPTYLPACLPTYLPTHAHTHTTWFLRRWRVQRRSLLALGRESGGYQRILQLVAFCLYFYHLDARLPASLGAFPALQRTVERAEAKPGDERRHLAMH